MHDIKKEMKINIGKNKNEEGKMIKKKKKTSEKKWKNKRSIKFAQRIQNKLWMIPTNLS